MKCKECSACKLGYFKSRPFSYVCTGAKVPFIIEGILIGVVGASIPLILLRFIYEKAVEAIMSKFSILNTILDFLPASKVFWMLVPIGLLLGVGIGFIGSFFTIKKHLKA